MLVNIEQNSSNTINRGGMLMSDKTKIIKVKKNTDGDITDVMFENGNVYSINEAIMMAKDGLVEGVNVGRAKNGREYLRSNPNGDKNDNLDKMPTF
jgi:tRNA-dihydrouridine synthase